MSLSRSDISLSVALAKEPAAGEKLLLVYLHGLVTLVETQDDFKAYLISMTTEHRYLGGTWLAEREIPKGAKGTLKGVIPGTAGLLPKEHPLLKISELPDPTHTNVRAVLTLPRPRAVHYLNRGTIDIVAGNKEKLADTPDTVSALRILEYGIETDYDSVFIQDLGLDWVCGRSFTTFPNGSQVASLHVFDIPMGAVSDTHHVDEFALSSRVLGTPLVISNAIPSDVENNDLPPGVTELELLGLDERQEGVSDILLDFLRIGKWETVDARAGSCRPCCTGPDGVLGS